MKPGAHLDQRTEPAFHGERSFRRHGDARENLEDRALACAVGSDEPDGCAALDLEAHVAKRPEGVSALRIVEERGPRELAVQLVAFRDVAERDDNVAHRLR